MQEADPGTGVTSEWTFTVADGSITIANPDSGMAAEETYELDGNILTLTDADEEWMRLQQGYEEPATASLPSAVPADGDSFSSTIDLPNGDQWILDITRTGDTYAIEVGEPQDEAWTCASGDEAPEAAAAAPEAAEEPAEPEPASFDLSTRSGWCGAAFDASGLDEVYGVDAATEDEFGNQGNERLAFAWNCVYNTNGTGWTFQVHWTPGSMQDPSVGIQDSYDVMNPNFTVTATTWNGADGTFTYGVTSDGTTQASATGVVTGADGAPGAATVFTATSDLSDAQASEAFTKFFAFAAANPPQAYTD